MNTLHLTLKRKWFDMILLENKKEEYREIKPYWTNRIYAKKYKYITFRNGYARNAPQFTIELKNISQSTGKTKWGAEQDKMYFVLHLGKIINRKFIKQ